MTDPSHAVHEMHGEHHGHSHGKLYGMVFLALCVLTIVSFGSYYAFRETPHVGWAVMMAVSCMKALLVIMFFMHLLWEANWKYVLTFPAMFMSIFLVLMLVPDVGRRMHHYNRDRELHAAEPAGADHGEAGDSADGHAPAVPRSGAGH